MDFSLSLENVSAWREGHVMNDIVFNLGCCCPELMERSKTLIIEIFFKAVKSSLIFIEIMAVSILIHHFNIRKDLLSTLSRTAASKVKHDIIHNMTFTPCRNVF